MTSKQRAYLKGLAMTMEPILQVGKSSITPEHTAAVAEALEARELIKLHVLKNCVADAGRGSCAYRVNLAFDSCDPETSGNTGRYYEPGTCVCANHFIWHYICVCL